MTTKELLYIEDTLGHEKFIKEQCQKASGSLTDPVLADYVKQLEQKHTQIFNQFYGLV